MYQLMLSSVTSEVPRMSLTSGANKWASRAVVVLQLAAWSAVGVVLLQKGVSSLQKTSETKNSTTAIAGQDALSLILKKNQTKEASDLSVIPLRSNDPGNRETEGPQLTGNIYRKDDLGSREKDVISNDDVDEDRKSERQQIANDESDEERLKEIVNKSSISADSKVQVEEAGAKVVNDLENADESTSEWKHIEGSYSVKNPAGKNKAEDGQSLDDRILRDYDQAKRMRDDTSEERRVNVNDAILSTNNPSLNRTKLKFASPGGKSNLIEPENNLLQQVTPLPNLSTEFLDSKESSMAGNAFSTTPRYITRHENAWEARRKMRLSHLSGGGAAAAVAMVAVGAVMLVLGPAVIILRALDERRQERRFLKLSGQDDLPPSYEQATLMDEAPRYSTLSLNTIFGPPPPPSPSPSPARVHMV